MRMLEPLPINSPDDPEVPDNLKDYGYTAPLDASGSDFPCKGYHEEETSHVSKATYQAGGSGKLTIQSNSATHGGGSCQISLSYDNGATWKVIKSMIGGCPITLDYDFTVPQDAPSSDDALLAWTWFNLVGNREMYMNCARVTIEGSAPGRHRRAQVFRREGELDSLPDMFTCNIGQGCTTKEGQNVEFPEPGDDVVEGENSMDTQPGSGLGDSTGSSGSSGSSGGDGAADAGIVNGSGESGPSVPANGASTPTIPASSASPAFSNEVIPIEDSDSEQRNPSEEPAPSNQAAGVSSPSSAESTRATEDSASVTPAAEPPASLVGPNDSSQTLSPFLPPFINSTSPSQESPDLKANSSVTGQPPQTVASEASLADSTPMAASSAVANSTSLAGGSCKEGDIICDSETTWSMCVHGTPMAMGSVADGTTCMDGQIS